MPTTTYSQIDAVADPAVFHSTETALNSAAFSSLQPYETGMNSALNLESGTRETSGWATAQCLGAAPLDYACMSSAQTKLLTLRP